MTSKILRVLLVFLLIFAIVGCTSDKQGPQETYKNIDDTVTHGQNYDGSFSREGIQEVTFENGVFYQIFVYNFRDSTGDGVGDLGGIIESLDYIESLGVNGIWLTPITHGASYHKYDVVDYYAVDPEFGTMEDFETLISEAHKRGIKVIIDLVINHTSDRHPWFKAAASDPNSKFRDYYIWAAHDEPRPGSGWRHLSGTTWFYLAHFWERMPDLNFDNPAVREEVKRIAKFWLDKGVDGFRLDAAKHLYSDPAKNHQFWNEFYQYLRTLKEDVYLVGEIWDSPEVIAPYFANGLNANFNFQIGGRVASSINSGVDNLGKELDRIYKLYREHNPDFIDAPFLSNHDTRRIMSEFDYDFEKMKMAANVLLSLPGDPYIFAGEEIGMISNDNHMDIREPFKWYKDTGPGQTTWRPNAFNSTEKWSPSVEEQDKDPNSLLNHFRKMVNLRNSHYPLRYGNDFQLVENNNLTVLSFIREYQGERVLVVHNFYSQPQTITVTVEGTFTNFKGTKSGANFTQRGNEITITIPPLSSMFIY
uniref:Alpha-amylase n=1 Tax=Anaerobranca gottschalkii TaxID=108328 RepID=Q5I942_9FIRM|nr:alpha-amylase precursor [Anaerobranca gottschalkii]